MKPKEKIGMRKQGRLITSFAIATSFSLAPGWSQTGVLLRVGNPLRNATVRAERWINQIKGWGRDKLWENRLRRQ
jgi:hypothetical protein